MGLSPLARGNQGNRHNLGRRYGPIPARAGEPLDPRLGQSQCRAYPRSRGGTIDEAMPFPVAKGLSPLARGNRAGVIVDNVSRGPIPARAGEPVCHQLGKGF